MLKSPFIYKIYLKNIVMKMFTKTRLKDNCLISSNLVFLYMVYINKSSLN